MKKAVLHLVVLLLIGSRLTAQFNITQAGYLNLPDIHGEKLNDIWGYVDEDGNEYAIVGAENGVSIVDVTNPATPVEVFWAFGTETIWRDPVTYGDYCYVTTEAEAGLWIIDLSPLPESTVLPITVYTGPAADPWNTAHTCHEQDGFLYIYGAGRDNKGVIILDVATDPLNPIEVGVFDNWYCHDGVVRNDTGYFAHIYDGFFSIVDLTDKSNPVLLGTSFSPTNFTHNCWYTDDGNYLFTTDEVSGGYIGAFDVSDPSAIVQIDKIQSNPGLGRAPHNVHVKGNYIYSSYYNDGVLVHDITHPHNMVEVGFFDTSPDYATTTFNGCWGLYPFLPSGNLVASDREKGLYILTPSEHQGSYLEGNITEFGTGNPVNNVTVTVSGTTVIDHSDIFGDYATGIEAAATRDVTFFKVLYYPQTVSVNFANGVIASQDIVLEKIPLYNITIQVLDATTLLPVPGADVLLEHTYLNHPGVTDAAGIAVIDLYYEDNYQVFAGKWGYQSACFVDTLLDAASATLVLYIEQGIYDDFVFDFGWSSTGSAARGLWEREVPVGVIGGPDIQNPFDDAPWDCGEYAWMTGNGAIAANTDEVNDGTAVLISPPFDLTGFLTPHINFSLFYFNKHGAFAPNDTLEVFLYNGTDLELIERRYFDDDTSMGIWVANSIPVAGLIPMTSTMQLIVSISDYLSSENVTEAALDLFSVTEMSITGIDELPEAGASVYVWPNPTNDVLNVMNLPDGAHVAVSDLQGRVLITSDQSIVDVGDISSGLFIVTVSDDNAARLYSCLIVVKH